MKQTTLHMIAVAAGLLLCSCGKKTYETRPVRKDVTETVFASGVLEAEGVYNLTAQTDGYLLQVNFKEGDTVSAGHILAVIDNRENIVNTQNAAALYDIARSNTAPTAPLLAQAASAIQLARQKMVQDSMQEQRYRRLLESASIARTDYENVLLQYNTSQSNYKAALDNYRQLQQQARQQLIGNATQKTLNSLLQNHNRIKAVLGGRVYKKYRQPGDYVKKGEVIAVIGDAGLIYAKVSIDETNIARIRQDQQVVIRLNTNQEKTYRARVVQIFPSFDEASQSFTCKIYFTDTLDFNITGTQLQANIIVGIEKNALLIPRGYLDFAGCVTVKGQKQPVPVRTKFISGEWVQVLGGIDDNTIIVTESLTPAKMKDGSSAGLTP